MTRNWNLIEELRGSGASWAEVATEVGENENTLRSAYSRRKRSATPPVNTRFPDYVFPAEADELNWRDLLDTWDEVNDQVKRIDPYVEYYTVDLRDIDGPVAVPIVADLHMGGGFTDHKAIRETTEFILDTPNMFAGFTGDTIEGFLADGRKPAETVEQMAGSTKTQLYALETLVDEFIERDSVLWMTWGDHDAKWFEQAIGLNVVKHAVHRKVPYFTGKGLIRLLVGDQEYYILLNHTWPGNSMYNPNHEQGRAYRTHFPADVVASGHLHKPAFQMYHHYAMLREAGLNLGGKAWMVRAGTFKTGPDPYSIRTWSRGILGVPTAVFMPDQHDVDVFESPEKAMRYINGRV